MLATAAFDRDAVAFTAGEPRVHRSSAVCERAFCGGCGSSLFTRYASGGAFDDVIFIGLGTLSSSATATGPVRTTSPSMHPGTAGGGIRR